MTFFILLTQIRLYVGTQQVQVYKYLGSSHNTIAFNHWRPVIPWNLFFFLIFWPSWAACRILVPQPGRESMPTAVEAQRLNHWTSREVPSWNLFLTFYRRASAWVEEFEDLIYLCHRFCMWCPWAWAPESEYEYLDFSRMGIPTIRPQNQLKVYTVLAFPSPVLKTPLK